MKLLTALSMAGFILVPAMSFAKDPSTSGGAAAEVNNKLSTTMAPSRAGEDTSAKIGGNKCYPDWAAVSKTEGASSQNCPSSEPSVARASKTSGSQPNSANASANNAANRQGAAASNMQNTSEGANENKPSLIEKAERALGSITGRPAAEKEEVSASKEENSQKGENTSEGANENKPSLIEKAERALGSITGRPAAEKEEVSASKEENSQKGDRYYPDWNSIAKTEPASKR